MPVSTFSAIKVFSDKKNRNVVPDKDNDRDFSQKMADAIDVEQIDTNLYLSKELWRPLGSRGVFGGQIVAQALRAAWDTVPVKFHVHSLHSYFILAGDPNIPVIYQVQRLREGRSYATRSVTATQRGKAIFVCSLSFSNNAEEVAVEHQTPMPDVIGPEELTSDDDRIKDFLESSEDLHPKLRAYLERRIEEEHPIDNRDVVSQDPWDYLTGAVVKSSVQRRWFKTHGKMSDDPRLHACIIAYASDSNLLMTAAQANGVALSSIGMMTSLDHSIWFHAPARADEWLLHDMSSPRSNNGRGTSLGRIYSADGTLVATTAQEGVIRLSRLEQQRRLMEKEAEEYRTAKKDTSRL